MERTNKLYIQEITKINRLLLEEEVSLAKRIANGDKEALDKLVKANLLLVVKIANSYRGYMDLDDLVCEGNVGLIHAAEKFNPVNGAKFSTYAAWWIKAYIQKAIRETSTGVKFPATRWQEMKQDKWQIVSLDKTISDDETITLGSVIEDNESPAPEEMVIKELLKNSVDAALNCLDSRERYILVSHYGINGAETKSLSEIAAVIGCSKERVRQIEAIALRKLQHPTICSKLSVADVA